MNKNAYQAPQMEVVNLNMEAALLAGSGTPTGSISNDEITTGNVDARPNYGGIWGMDDED